jgi:polysaccharide deacetylase 2 family uncharacterized protein YibQ
MAEQEEETPQIVEAPAKPKLSSRKIIFFIVVAILILLSIAGIIVAATSTAIDPASVKPPEVNQSVIDQDQKTLVEEQKPAETIPMQNPEAASPEMAAPAPVQEAPKDVPQTDAPLTLPSQKSTPLPLEPKKEPVAPQSMIHWKEPVAAKIPAGKFQIAIVIDDMGLAQKNSREMATMDPALTLSYMPYAEHLHEQTKAAFDNGHELIVHMPMEPDDIKHNNPGPDALLTTNTAEENVARLNRNLSKFDGYIGMNNHMGSRMTASETAMRPVMEAFKEKGLWFLDSRTIGNSVAGKLAAEMHVPYVDRDVFLDNAETVPAILKQLQQVEQVSRKKGYVVAIGHPYTQTIEALREWIPQAKQQGFKLVPLSAIIAERFPAAPVPHYARLDKSVSVAQH